MSKLLTGYECLTYFSEMVQKQIRTNIVAYVGKDEAQKCLEDSYADVVEFLHSTFAWNDTPEEYEYWETIADGL